MINQKIDVVIVDDDALCIKHLKDSLATFEAISIVGTAQTARQGKDLILTHRPALVFLDVELPDTSGIDLLRDLNATVDWGMQVVFYTAYDKYLLDALRQSAFDYILKPFEKEELTKVMERFFHVWSDKPSTIFHDEINRLFPSTSVLMVTTFDGFRMLHLEQVGYFRYLNDKKRWVAMLSDLSEVHLKKSVTASNILKYSDLFMQINRDQIINVSYLSMVKGAECLLLPPFDRLKGLSVNRKFIRQLQERFSLM
jgi:two-component system, LytTR family, response regulator